MEGGRQMSAQRPDRTFPILLARVCLRDSPIYYMAGRQLIPRGSRKSSSASISMACT
jgi:hypothetical protein